MSRDVKLGVLGNPNGAIERIGGAGAEDLDVVKKLEAQLDKIEREEALRKGGADDDPIAKNERLVDEVLDPDYFAKRERAEALQKWRNEPVPPKTAGPGVPHLKVEKIEELAKANGFGMKEGDYFRKL